MKVSYNQLTDLTGKTYRTIKKRIDAAGLQPVGGKSGANLWDSKAVLEAIYAPMAVCEGLVPAQEKAALDKERRKTQEIKNRETAERLIDVEEAQRICDRLRRMTIEHFKPIPMLLARKLVNMTDQDEVQQFMDSEIRQALFDLVAKIRNDDTGSGRPK